MTYRAGRLPPVVHPAEPVGQAGPRHHQAHEDDHALDVVGADDRVQPAEQLVLVGQSGCGKTTLLRIVAGLELADAGQVFSGGREITGLPAIKRPVNTVFQSYALFPHLSIYDNVAFGLRLNRFRGNMEGITPILSAVAPDSTMTRKDGPHSVEDGAMNLKGV